MNTSLLFILGRAPELSIAELHSIFPEKTFLYPSPSTVEIVNVAESPAELLQILGGVIKIAKKLTTVSIISPKLIAEELVKIHGKEKRLSFGISTLDGVSVSKKLLDDVKRELKSLGLSSRFLEASSEHVLSSVVVAGQELIELVLFPDSEGISIAQTLAVQDANEWNARDYGRPYADAKRGMLPLKVSRIIANIALGMNPTDKTLVDPFCGMGTIIGEAYLRGAKTIGVDIEANAVQKAQKNLEWLVNRKPIEKKYIPEFFTGDAVHLSDLVQKEFDVIATEPYMGKNSLALKETIDVQEVKNTLKGLEKLYIGCLKDWHHRLGSNGRIIMAIPTYIINKHEYTVKTIIDSCEKFGYSMEAGPLPYSRPQAVVKRNFYIFKKR